MLTPTDAGSSTAGPKGNEWTPGLVPHIIRAFSVTFTTASVAASEAASVPGEILGTSPPPAPPVEPPSEGATAPPLETASSAEVPTSQPSSPESQAPGEAPSASKEPAPEPSPASAAIAPLASGQINLHREVLSDAQSDMIATLTIIPTDNKGTTVFQEDLAVEVDARHKVFINLPAAIGGGPSGLSFKASLIVEPRWERPQNLGPSFRQSS